MKDTIKGLIEFKEMEYSSSRSRELLSKFKCYGFNCYIMNLGTHPTAYIEIPGDNKFFGDYDLELDVHGGITYHSGHLLISEDETLEGWFIRLGLCTL